MNLPLQTKRLLLRPVQPGDGLAVNEALKESFEQFKEWFLWLQKMPTVDESEMTARKFYSEYLLQKDLHLAIFQEEKLIGMCGFLINRQIPSAEIGYWCRTSYQGQGYMREAIEAAVQFGFKELGLKKIAILCHEKNVKSIALAEKLGFILELKTKGLVAKPGTCELCVGLRYVRFS